MKACRKGVMNGSVRYELVQLFLKLSIIAFVLYFGLTYVFGVSTCKTLDMHPALKIGDLILFYRLEEEFDSGTVVVYKNSSDILIQRIVAVAGDTIDITEDGLIINGELQDEPIYGIVTNPCESNVTYPLTLGYGYYFILGDNRSETNDSRVIGVVSDDDILGTVITVLRRRNF